MKYEITLIQNEMKKEGIAAYVVPSDDYHGSEYVGAFFKCREFLSGFTGSAGTLLITENEAFLWTDGRYFIQAEEELKGTDIKLMRMGEENVPTITQKLKELAKESKAYVVGFDGRVVSYGFGKSVLSCASNIKIKDISLIDRVWNDRPPMACEKVFELDVKYAGEYRSSKLTRVRKAMEKEGVDELFITSLDDIAWLFNLRGSDIPCNPVFLAYAKVTKDKAFIFTDKSRFDEALSLDITRDGVIIEDYGNMIQHIKSLPGTSKIWVDEQKMSYSLTASIPEGVKVTDKMLPTVLMKAVKNKTEMKNIRDSHLKDGVAVTKFLYWLKTNIGKEEITELDCVNKIEELRNEQDLYVGPSFDTIAAFGAHGAIVHYEPTEETNIPLKAESLALFDTGGQYLDGTTDITRTVALGPLTKEEKKYFTLVLKGHLNLAAAKFKKGCTGMALDYIARSPLWELGEDYNHGTGHGVGFFLNVHEAPNGFRYKKVPERDDGAVFEEGMLTSDEPGYYAEGKFGIRHENLLLCVNDRKTPYGEYLKFETVTLVPFDLDGIDKKLLTDKEKELLNAYHKRVCEKLKPYLTKEEGAWLEKATRAI
ncbi:MAG: aminopeptidase P family protein [Lachnospiraceae bacterium]|nr:aminopeptidase P family protein [Lachnospiraceae bacterium]